MEVFKEIKMFDIEEEKQFQKKYKCCCAFCGREFITQEHKINRSLKDDE
jgi:hypothetical protein